MSNSHYLKNKQLKQSVLLLVSSFVVMGLMIGINYFLTKLFDKESFGSYSLIINIFSFSQVIFNFGFFYSISRLIAQSESDQDQKEYYAVGLIYIAVLFLIMSLAMLLFTLLSVYWNKSGDFYSLLLVSIPFGWVYLLNSYNELVLQGNNRIDLLSISRIFPKLGFFIILAIIFFNKWNISLKSTIIFSFIASGFSYAYILIKLKPLFVNVKNKLKKVGVANKQFGFNIYIGSLFSLGASNLTGVLIGYFGVDNVEVGYFSIATQLCAPLSLIPNVIATSYFKKFVNANQIDKRLLLIMYVISIISLLAILSLARPFVIIIYGVEFTGALILVYLTAIGTMLYGIADFYNRFLLSKGMGKELMKASFIVGGILLLSNIILIYIWGGKGASASLIISGASYLLIINYYYNRIKIITKDVH